MLFFSLGQDCPTAFAASFGAELMPRVRIKGCGMDFFDVDVVIDGSSLSLTSGWDSFVESERIVRGDHGFFALVAPNLLVFMLFGANGVFKPMSERPAVWNLFVALGEHMQAATPVAEEAVVDDLACMLDIYGCSCF